MVTASGRPRWSLWTYPPRGADHDWVGLVPGDDGGVAGRQQTDQFVAEPQAAGPAIRSILGQQLCLPAVDVARHAIAAVLGRALVEAVDLVGGDARGQRAGGAVGFPQVHSLSASELPDAPPFSRASRPAA